MKLLAPTSEYRAVRFLEKCAIQIDLDKHEYLKDNSSEEH